MPCVHIIYAHSLIAWISPDSEMAYTPMDYSRMHMQLYYIQNPPMYPKHALLQRPFVGRRRFLPETSLTGPLDRSDRSTQGELHRALSRAARSSAFVC